MSIAPAYGRMQSVSRQHPCPVCGKPDWCLVAADGSAAICPRTEQGAVKRAGDAGWLHLLDGEAWDQRPFASLPVVDRTRPQRDWTKYLAAVQRDCDEPLNELARKLGVSSTSLTKLEVGFDAHRQWWVFPERNALGAVIGVSRRGADGTKKRLWGSQAGLYFADRWDQAPGSVLLVEGASDTAALLTLGLCAVGRPSNTGGVDHLIGLLESVSADREIIVIGERDQKPYGRWPGREGAVSTAHQLAEALERPIAWSLPPDDAKDARAWLKAAPRGLPPNRLADLFLTGLARTVIQPIPIHVATEPTGPVTHLADWRSHMLTQRLMSLSSPGCYFDASPTGSGKTNVDLQVLQRARLQGAA